jgi:predicted nucleotidyltransferase
MLKAGNKEPVSKGGLNSAVVLIPSVSEQLPEDTMVKTYLDSVIDVCSQISSSDEAITAERKDIIINAFMLFKKALADSLYAELSKGDFTVSTKQEFQTLRSVVAMKYLGEEFE